MRLVYRVISCDRDWEDRSLALGIHENVMLSTRDRDEYTGLEKL